MISIRAKLLLAMSIMVGTLPPSHSHAAQFKRIYRFLPNQIHGFRAEGPLVLGPDGNFYGETETAHNREGSLFKVTPEGQLTTLHYFSGLLDGTSPQGGLISDSAGNLYGTTPSGGNKNHGTVYKLAPDGTKTILHVFGNLAGDGLSPFAGLTIDDLGNLYGVTSGGGSNNLGTVFKITPSGVETVLHSFALSEGCAPEASLLRDKDGALYGTATGCGKYSYGGTVFRLNADGHLKVLHSFKLNVPNDGWGPEGGLTFGRDGYLYGTTYGGGPHDSGTVYRIKRDGFGEALVHTFKVRDGLAPACSLIVDAKGNLYGTTQGGGTDNFGVVFKVTPSGKETVLHSFKGPDGAYPIGALTFDASGNLYGDTTGFGPEPQTNAGTIFKITLKPN